MIYADSRYANANVYKSYVPRLDANSVTVERTFPTDSSRFYFYQVSLGERMEQVAQATLGDSSLWYVIMDYNPELLNPFNVPLGTVLRIPYDV